MNAYVKFRCAALCIKKALGIFRELVTTKRTTRVAFWDPYCSSKKYNDMVRGRLQGRQGIGDTLQKSQTRNILHRMLGREISESLRIATKI